MVDQWERTIDYMRISITDRCNLRCQYCMPQGAVLVEHNDLLTYEEILRVCAAAVSLGITKFKITGGEPLIRRGCVAFIQKLKSMPGVEQVTLTTNGLLLANHLDGLAAVGIDGINLSLDTLHQTNYNNLTGWNGAIAPLMQTLLADCVQRRLRIKLNTVLLDQTPHDLLELAKLAEKFPIDVRFIELMPIGFGKSMQGMSALQALEHLKTEWPDLAPTDEKRGNGPARYYHSDALQGKIGWINAVSQTFCAACNRVRLTSVGELKSCLCYDAGVDLKPLLRNDPSDAALRTYIEHTIYNKPQEHCFAKIGHITEQKSMNQIGG